MNARFRCIALCLGLLLVPLAQAQQLDEPFDDITQLGSRGWVQTNLSSPGGIIGWFQGTATTANPTPGPFDAYDGAANSYAAANFNNTQTSSGTISNWLITPVVTLSPDTVVTFWTRKAAPDSYADRLEVRVSTKGPSTDVGTTATSVGDFTLIAAAINPSLVLGVYPTVWTQYTLDLSGLPTGSTRARVAFRYFVTNGGPGGTNGDYIGIDHVTVGAAPPCGNGVLEGTEACDDGNLSNGDGCDATCAVESTYDCSGTPSVCNRCGDGVARSGEACDDGNTDDTDACHNDCTYARCGDGMVRAGVEACDDGNDDWTDGCLNDCTIATCGDGVVEAGVEACDDWNRDDTDACRNDCTPARCGDGVVQAGVEACDDGNLDSGDGCSASCVVEPGTDGGMDTTDGGTDTTDGGTDTTDGGTDTTDGGTDGGTQGTDGGIDPGPGPDGGCGCSSGAGGQFGGLVMLGLGLVLVRRRRDRAAERPSDVG